VEETLERAPDFLERAPDFLEPETLDPPDSDEMVIEIKPELQMLPVPRQLRPRNTLKKPDVLTLSRPAKVDRIIGCKIGDDGAVMYHVRWVNAPDTWELITSLRGPTRKKALNKFRATV
jgi:hypothetical protein